MAVCNALQTREAITAGDGTYRLGRAGDHPFPRLVSPSKSCLLVPRIRVPRHLAALIDFLPALPYFTVDTGLVSVS